MSDIEIYFYIAVASVGAVWLASWMDKRDERKRHRAVIIKQKARWGKTYTRPAFFIDLDDNE